MFANRPPTYMSYKHLVVPISLGNFAPLAWVLNPHMPDESPETNGQRRKDGHEDLLLATASCLRVGWSTSIGS